MSKDVIVIGGNHHNTLSILRSLGERGVLSKLIVISEDHKPYVGYSKYIKEMKVIQSVEEIIPAMYSLRQSDDKPVVIACADIVSSWLDSNYGSLANDFILPGAAEEGKITCLMNKNTMMQVAVDSGILVPRSWIVYPSDPKIGDVTYPCIAKPLVSKNGSKADIAICESKIELQTYLTSCNCEELQIQEYIVKDIEFQLIGCSLNGGEEVIIPGVSIIIRQPKNTNTGFLKYVPISEFTYDRLACIDFIRNTGYSGLFSLEFIRDKSGKDFFMEINFRNDGNSICVTAAGMNLPYIWYAYGSNLPIESELKYDNMTSVLVMPEFNDIGNAIHRRISWLQWLKDVKNTDRFMEFSKYDQKPFWMYILKRIFHI